MRAVVVVSSDIEWRVTRGLFPDVAVEASPLGEWFGIHAGEHPVIVFHGGWGKIAAAASVQYIVDRWSPTLLINFGTCGGFEGSIELDEIVLVERAIAYDIAEQMTDPEEAIAHYTTRLDLSWLGDRVPHPVRRSLIVSGDRDLITHEVASLRARFGAVAGDWESAAIAWVTARNAVRCLILRGVSDLVGPSGAPAYGNVQVFVQGATRILARLFAHLPAWIALGLSEPASSFELQPMLAGRLLELRPLRVDDFDNLFAAASDPLIWEQHPEPDRYLREVFQRYFDSAIASNGALAIVDRGTGRIIGSSRYWELNPQERSVEIGWTFLERAYWGGEYNAELKALMLEHAFRFLERAVFRVGPNNRRSQLALERLGAQRVAASGADGGRTSLNYVMDRTAWIALRAREA
jgi:nucleoside phosphorylase/RimJ/RimL family protein N-acetyltransferase